MAAGSSRSAHRSSIAPASSTATRPHPTRPHPTLLRALAAALAASLTSLASADCTLLAPGEARDAPDARSRTASLACTRRVAAWARRVAASSTWGCGSDVWGGCMGQQPRLLGLGGCLCLRRHRHQRRGDGPTLRRTPRRRRRRRRWMPYSRLFLALPTAGHRHRDQRVRCGGRTLQGRPRLAAVDVPRLLAEQHGAARRLRASVGEPPLKRRHLAAEQRARDARLRAHRPAGWIA
jgi:hypothetical protein